MDIKKADIILKELFDSYPEIVDVWKLVIAKNICHEKNEIYSLLDSLIDDDLITKEARTLYRITSKAREIIEEHGSLELFNEYVKNERTAKAEVEDIKIEKLRYDAKLSKWQVKTFWPVFIFGIIGGVFGIISFVMQVTADNSPQQNKSVVKPFKVLKTDSLELKKATHLNEGQK